MSKTPIILITGPSCTGKSYISDHLKRDGNIQDLISHTTRPTRPNEIQGESYHFVSEPIFNDLLDKGEMLEHVNVNGVYYGTALSALENVIDANKIPVLVLEPTGADFYQSISSSINLRPITCFININPRNALYRMLDRLNNDPAPLFHQYATRVDHLLQVETTLWRKAIDYDLFFASGSQGVSDVHFIADTIHQAINDPTFRYPDHINNPYDKTALDQCKLYQANTDRVARVESVLQGHKLAESTDILIHQIEQIENITIQHAPIRHEAQPTLSPSF